MNLTKEEKKYKNKATITLVRCLGKKITDPNVRIPYLVEACLHEMINYPKKLTFKEINEELLEWEAHFEKTGKSDYFTQKLQAGQDRRERDTSNDAPSYPFIPVYQSILLGQRDISLSELFQLLDGDGEQVGLIESTLPNHTIEAEWKDFSENHEDVGADTFEEYLQEVHHNHISSRTFTIVLWP